MAGGGGSLRTKAGSLRNGIDRHYERDQRTAKKAKQWTSQTMTGKCGDHTRRVFECHTEEMFDYPELCTVLSCFRYHRKCSLARRSWRPKPSEMLFRLGDRPTKYRKRVKSKLCNMASPLARLLFKSLGLYTMAITASHRILTARAASTGEF